MASSWIPPGTIFQAWSERLADELGIPFTEEDNEQLKGLSQCRLPGAHPAERRSLVLDNHTKVRLMEQQESASYLALVRDHDCPPSCFRG